MSSTAQDQTHKERVKLHYDSISDLYKAVWGHHIHHGYYRTGKESKEEAQILFIEELCARAELDKFARSHNAPLRILDIGCGIGGTSVHLAKKYGAQVTGITLSPKQVQMAKEMAKQQGMERQVQFYEMDGENITLPGPFDLIWCAEVLSHFPHKVLFFKQAQKLLRPGGKVVLADWMKTTHLTNAEEERDIKPIEEDMIVPNLSTPIEYVRYFDEHKLRVELLEDISLKVAQTWDDVLALSSELPVTDEMVQAVLKHSEQANKDGFAFVGAFEHMRRGFANRSFLFVVFVATKPDPNVVARL